MLRDAEPFPENMSPHEIQQIRASLARRGGRAGSTHLRDAAVALHGVPDNPRGWLFQVARNRALDQFRRQAALRTKEPDLVGAFRARAPGNEPLFAHELRDDQLWMMLVCCHPATPRDSCVTLTLKTVGGFAVNEIARAFLTKKETIAQRIVRAKKLIRDEGIPMEMPSCAQLPAHLDSLLKALYLFFDEGSSAHGGKTSCVRTSAARPSGSFVNSLTIPRRHSPRLMCCSG